MKIQTLHFSKRTSAVLTTLFTLVLLYNPVFADNNTDFVIDTIIDGDTLLVHRTNKVSPTGLIKIQLRGIDAPEDTNNPKLQYDIKRTKLDAQQLRTMGQVATSFLKSKLSKDARVIIEADLNKKDRYGRIPALVFLLNTPSISLNEQMISNGFAITTLTGDSENLFDKKLRSLQKLALKQQAGLWGKFPTAAKLWSAKR